MEVCEVGVVVGPLEVGFVVDCCWRCLDGAVGLCCSRTNKQTNKLTNNQPVIRSITASGQYKQASKQASIEDIPHPLGLSTVVVNVKRSPVGSHPHLPALRQVIAIALLQGGGGGGGGAGGSAGCGGAREGGGGLLEGDSGIAGWG